MREFATSEMMMIRQKATVPLRSEISKAAP